MRGRAKRNNGSSPKSNIFDCDTGPPVESQGTLEVTFQLIDEHGVAITVKAVFELLPVRRPILSVSRLVDKGFAVVMGNDLGNTLGKNGRVIHLHRSNGVYHVRATALSELCPLEDKDPRNDDAPPTEALGEASVPRTRRLPHKPTEDERMAHSMSHFAIQSLVFTLRERVGTRLAPLQRLWTASRHTHGCNGLLLCEH